MCGGGIEFWMLCSSGGCEGHGGMEVMYVWRYGGRGGLEALEV
jgi:hypothetical protein